MVLELASLAGVRLALLFFALFAAGLGVIVGMLVVRRGPPRPATRRCGVAAGSCVACALFAAVYATSLDGFCRIELAGAELRLAHALPACDAAIPPTQVAAIAEASGIRPGLAVLELRLDDGRVFRSQSVPSERVKRARVELAARIAAANPGSQPR